MRTIYLCDNTLEGILCGVYDAWSSRKGHDNVKLELCNQERNIELFTEYEEVTTEQWKADKLVLSIRKKISEAAYEAVYKASLSKEPERADRIYRFLIYGFHIGSGVTDMLQIPAVFDIFTICRHLDHEVHLLTGFVRFAEMENPSLAENNSAAISSAVIGSGEIVEQRSYLQRAGSANSLLVSKIGPKNDVLVLLAPHFADRLSGENWIIYDEKRKKAVLHPSNRSWFLMTLDSPEWEDYLLKAASQDQYEELWKIFRKSITIKERVNPTCQLNHMPLRYRPYMTEFDHSLKD
jgi:probable DNA metabolism protein